MKSGPAVQHHRRSSRLPAYDYARPGAYFVTICIQDRERILGEVAGDQVVLSDAGKMIESVWHELPERYRGVELDAFVVMPNHLHGIVVLVGAGPRACPENAGRVPPGQPQGVAPTRTISLPHVVHRFKSLTAAKYRQGIRDNRWPPFPRRLWQRNYYEHVIRDDEDLDRIRRYVAENALRWKEDPENVL
jgi:REP element-mobilizing transposase RayT